MDLTTTKGDLVPIKAIPEAELNRKILDEFTPWITQLLSIKATEENVERLEVLLPMVKDNCWSMPISEIKKAFIMYVQGKLPIEPRDNYLTAILFSKVIEAYKQQRKVKTPKLEPPKMSDDEKLKYAKENIIIAYEKWEELGEVPSEFHTAFDSLYEWGILKDKDSSDKAKKWYDIELRRAWMMVHFAYKEKLKRTQDMDLGDVPKARDLEKKVADTKYPSHPEVQTKFRTNVLKGFFKKYTRDEIQEKLNAVS